MSKEFDVVVVGELNVDIIMDQIESLPVIGKEIIAEKMNFTLGSSTAIFANNIATLGASVCFVGKLGLDSFGNFIKETLDKKGIDTSQIIMSSELKTGATIVLNYDEDRANVTFPGAMDDLSLSDIKDECLAKARHLHISSIFLQKSLLPGLSKLLTKAKALGLTTSMDPQWDPQEKWDIDLDSLMPLIDIFLPNATELVHLTHSKDLEEALAKIKKYDQSTIVIKNGHEGALLWDGKMLIHQPVFSNQNVIDAIGAGDSFDAGYIKKFLEGCTTKECLEYGALMGAINTTGHGGTSSFSSLEKVNQIAQSVFNYSDYVTEG